MSKTVVVDVNKDIASFEYYINWRVGRWFIRLVGMQILMALEADAITVNGSTCNVIQSTTVNVQQQERMLLLQIIEHLKPMQLFL